jgi:hypothetical protein
MSQITEGTIYIVDSSQRLSGSNSEFSYQMILPKGNEYNRVLMLQAIIPKSYYLIDAPHNVMTLSENGVNRTVTLTPGNYNAVMWTSFIGALLTSSSSQGYTYTCTIPNSNSDVSTGKFTYRVTGNGLIQPIFIFPEESPINEQFGFDEGSSTSFAGGALTSTNVVKFQNEDALMIHSDISKNNDQSSFSDVLQEIYASSTPSFTNVIYQNTGLIEAYSKELTTKNNNVFNFKITDEHNNVLNLNGLNCLFTILVYRKDEINQLIARGIETYLRKK